MKKYLLIFCMLLVLTVTASAATVYVSDGGTGNGASASAPLGSLTDAYTTLGDDGGEIVLCGTVTVPLHKGDTTRTAFVEPAHTGKITVRGETASTVLLFASPYEYHMSGETEFKNMTISSGDYVKGISICARGHHLTMGEGLTMHSTGVVSGTTQVGSKVYLSGGCIPNATVDGYLNCANHLTVKSGTYWGIIGFNRGLNVATAGSSTIEVGGDVATHYLIAGSSGTSSFVAPSASEIYIIGDLTVTQQISLGNQNSDVTSFDSNLILLDGKVDFTENFIDYTARKRMTTLDIYYDTASEAATTSYETYFKGYGDREGSLSAYCANELGGHTFANGSCTRCGAVEQIQNADVVYVSDGGEGSGASAASPLGSLTDAYKALGADGGEIVLLGTVSVPLNKEDTTRNAFVEPAHSGKVTLRGTDESATLLFASVYEYHMSGETEIRDVIISSGARTSGINFCARGHHLTMGEGLTMHSTGVVSGTTQIGTKVYLQAGCIPGATVSGYQNCSNRVTVKSGIYWGIIGFNRNINVISTGKTVIEVGGDVSTHYLIAGSSGTSDFAAPASAEVHIIGDLTITQQLSLGNQNTRPLSFASSLFLHDGNVRITGTLVDYNARTRLSDLAIYVNPESESAVASYHRYFAGYGDRESTMTNGSACNHTFTESTNGTVVTSTCSVCGLTAKITTKTDTVEGVFSRTVGDLRVQILADGILRIEEKKDSAFTDAATLVVPDRTAFTGTAVTADEDSDTVILSTTDYTVNIPKNGSISDVRIFDKDGGILYDYFTTEKLGFYASLPAPSETPDAIALIDNGILPAENGLAYVGSEDDTSDWERTENLDMYVLLPLGNAAALRRQFITVTGPTMLSTVKTLGSWYSKWTRYSAEEKLALIEEFRSRDIPLDLFVIDTEWKSSSANGNDGDGTGYDTNDELYPDMEGFLAKSEAAGVLVLFNDHTHKTSLLITSPEELKWQCAGILSLIEMGLDGWWYDRNWSYTIKTPYTDVTYTTLGQVLYYDTMANWHAEHAASRVLMLTNVDWIRHGHPTGNPSIIGHRYGTQWTGDIYWDPAHLKREISNMVTAGVNGGSPYLSADLGGFWDKDWVSENNFLRWMQYGAFSPVYRPHGSLSSTNEHLPWSYGEDSTLIVKDFLHMRYHLMPTYYALARENHESGMPLARRLDFHYPEYEESKDQTQYLLGKDVLVAPFWGTTGDGRDVVPTEWLTAADGTNGLDAAYFTYTAGADRETFYSGTPVFTETVPTVDFYWYAVADGMPGSPNSTIAEDYFAASFTGKITPAYDCYIGMLADDCARIYVNGNLHVNWKSGQLAPNFNNTTVLKAGITYDIVVHCYEGTGKAAAYLMCEPVLPQNTSAREVFIPRGTWWNAFTGEKVTGPKTITVTGSTAEMPVFIREGAAILVSDVISPMTGADWQDVSLNLYGLSETAVTLYEDDGMTTEYLDGEYRKTPVTVTPSGDAWQVTVGATEGAFATEYTTRTVRLRVHSATNVTATMDGSPLPVTVYEADETALPFANKGASNISNVYEITVDAALANETAVTLTLSPAGDVSGDGTLSIADALLALQALVNADDCPAADMNGDGALSLLDILSLLKAIVQ